MAEKFDSFAFELTPEDLAQIDALDRYEDGRPGRTRITWPES